MHINISDSNTFCIVILDESLKIKHHSLRLQQLGNFSPGELKNSSFIELISRVEQEQLTRLMEECLKSEYFQFDMVCQMHCKKQQFYWVHWEFRTFEDNSKKSILGIGQDVTLQYKFKDQSSKTEYIQLKQEEKYKTLIEMSSVGVALNNMEGQFIEINPALIRMTGYTLEELKKLSYWDITPIEYKDQEAIQLLSLEKTGRYGPYEKEYIHKNGTRFPVLLRGQIYISPEGEKMIYSTIEDLSSLKKTETQLTNAKALLNDILESSSQISIMATDKDGIITMFNRGAENMLGYSAEDVIGKLTPRTFHLQAEIDDYVIELKDQYKFDVSNKSKFFEPSFNQKKTSTKEWTFVTKKGNYIRVINSVSPIFNSRNELSGYLGLALDVTELRKKENIILEQNDKLKQVTFIQSHIIRHPVSNMLAALSLIQPQKLDSENHELMLIIDKSCRTIDQIISKLIIDTSPETNNYLD